MRIPPDTSNPYRGTWNTALPVHNGSIAATFVAFGYVKELYNTGLSDLQADMGFLATVALTSIG